MGSELKKLIGFSDIRKLSLYHYRDGMKREVDFILSNNNDINIGIEVKASMTPNREMAKHLKFLITQGVISHGYVIHSGSQQISLGDKITAIPVTQLFA